MIIVKCITCGNCIKESRVCICLFYFYYFFWANLGPCPRVLKIRSLDYVVMQCARSQRRTNLNSSKTESEHESVRSQAERVTKLPFRTQNSSPFVFLNTVFNSLH